MKTTSKNGRNESGMKKEYKLDYSKAKPNRFASKEIQGSMVVVLEDDISTVFNSPESVKAVLRALIRTMPGFKGGKAHQTG
jgi:hypothetical protein